ncbi:MAG: LytTR family DNA-binding domain-containing protein [Acidobacteriota bacterium]
MEIIRALIVDDEVQARKGIRALLARDAEIKVIGECSDGGQAIAEIEQTNPDLIFLDIQMPEKNGFEVLRALDLQRPPTVIFITAYDNFALQAFEVCALDYLLKPFSDERFYQALARAKAVHRQRHAHQFSERLLSLIENYRRLESPTKPETLPQAAESLKRFFVKTGGEVHFVAVDEVDWLEALGYYTKIHTGKKSHLLRGNLGSLEAQLDAKKFVRIHRSMVVNLSRVKSLKNWFHGECFVVLEDGTELKVSRSHRKELEARLEKFA